MYKLLCAAALFTILYGFTCPKRPMPLENTDWRLKKFIAGNATESVPADVMITATFKNGQLTGKGGCNTYHSSYTVTGNQLSIGAIAATKMYCPANNWESRYFTALQGSQSWKISGNTLTVQAPDASLVFERP